MAYDPSFGAWLGQNPPDPYGGLSLADLYRPMAVPQPAVLPPLADYSTLPQDEKDKARRLSMLRLAELLGKTGPGFGFGSALAQSAADTTAIKEKTVDDFRKEQAQRYQQERIASEDAYQKAQAEAQNANLQARAQANLGAYQNLASGPQGPAARFSAQVGDEGALASMLTKAPTEQWMRDHGYDPNDPTALMQAEHKTLGPIDLRNAVARQSAVGDVENKQRLSYLQQAGPIEASSAAARERAVTPALIDRLQQEMEAGVGADARAASRLAKEMKNHIVKGGDGHWYRVNPEGGAPVDTGIPGKDPYMYAAIEQAAAQEKAFERENPGEPFDRWGAVRKNWQAAHAALDPLVKTPAPTVPAAPRQPPPGRLDNPNGAPVGPTGTAGRPGVGSAPRETLSSYLQSLPPQTTQDPDFKKLIADLRASGKSENWILQKVMKGQALKRQQEAMGSWAMGQPPPQ